ncbi:MAG: tripartite tricarboxylate transporter substrate-binding protein, partial [Acidobacteriota bacterium]
MNWLLTIGVFLVVAGVGGSVGACYQGAGIESDAPLAHVGPDGGVPAQRKDGQSSAPLVLAVNASVPADNVADFIAYAKTQPSGLFYSSAGPGSLGLLGTELFAARAGI